MAALGFKGKKRPGAQQPATWPANVSWSKNQSAWNHTEQRALVQWLKVEHAAQFGALDVVLKAPAD